MQFVKNRAGDITIPCSLLRIGLEILLYSAVQFVKNRAGDITIQCILEILLYSAVC